MSGTGTLVLQTWTLGKRVVKLLYSPLVIFSEILAGKGAKVGWRSDGVGSNVGTPSGLTCVEE